MKFFKNILILFWRLWFYGWMIGTIIFALPVLVVVISREKWYPVFFKIARAWAKTILFVMGFKARVVGELKPKKSDSYMFCPNHTSMIDIMLMLAITDNPFVFLGKKELAKIPVFGYVYKRTCILVDREDTKSRKIAFLEAQRKLQNGLSVCIFPEGQVPDDESIILDKFHNGAFRLAIEHQIPIVPITFYDCKKRFSYTFFSGSPGNLRFKFHEFISTTNITIDERITLKNITHEVILTSLTEEIKISQTSFQKQIIN